MRIKWIPLAVTFALFAAGSASAAEFELTPSIGYRWGGGIDAGESPLFTTDVNIADDASYAFSFGIRPQSGLIIELFADRQKTAFVENNELFGEDKVLFDVDVTYYQVGVGWGWTRGDYEPFIVGALGMVQLDPDTPLATSEEDFSLSVGGGVKIWANHHVGFRFELRGFWGNINQDNDWPSGNWDKDLYQGEAKVGLVIRF